MRGLGIAFGLTLASLRARALSTGLYVLILALGVAAATALLLFSAQSERRLERDARSIDVVVGTKASSPLQLVMAGVFHVDTAPANIPARAEAALRADPRVKGVVPIALGDSVDGYRIVGAPDTILGLYGARFAAGAGYTAAFQAVVGADAARGLGLTVGSRFVGAHGMASGGHAHGDHPYTVVGVLAPTGSAVDRLVLTSLESVWDVHGIAHGPSPTPEVVHDHHEENETPSAAAAPAQGRLFANRGRIEAPRADVTMLLVTVRSPIGAESLMRDLNAGPDYLAARPASEAVRLYRLMGLGGQVLQVFAFILIGAAAASVFTTLYAALRERRGEIALLRAMGATRGTVFGVLMGQGLVIAAAGTVLGLLLGHGLIEGLAMTSAQAAGFGLSGFLAHPGEVLIALGGVLAGTLAALPAAIGAYRTDIARTLAEAG